MLCVCVGTCVCTGTCACVSAFVCVGVCIEGKGWPGMLSHPPVWDMVPCWPSRHKLWETILPVSPQSLWIRMSLTLTCNPKCRGYRHLQPGFFFFNAHFLCPYLNSGIQHFIDGVIFPGPQFVNLPCSICSYTLKIEKKVGSQATVLQQNFGTLMVLKVL